MHCNTKLSNNQGHFIASVPIGQKKVIKVFYSLITQLTYQGDTFLPPFPKRIPPVNLWEVVRCPYSLEDFQLTGLCWEKGYVGRGTKTILGRFQLTEGRICLDWVCSGINTSLLRSPLNCSVAYFIHSGFLRQILVDSFRARVTK